MDFGKAFTFPFDDTDWARKLIIPALISLIPILGQIFLIGWMLDIARRVIRRDPVPLPDLNFGEQLAEGFRGFVISLVYAIPVFILIAPIVISSIAVTDPGVNQDAAATVVSVISLCCSGLMLLYSLVLWVVLPAAYTNAAVKESLGAGLNFREVFGLIKAAPGPYLLALVGTLIGGVIAPLGSILCLVGVVLTYAYAMAVTGHLYGQAYRTATENQGLSDLPSSSLL